MSKNDSQSAYTRGASKLYQCCEWCFSSVAHFLTFVAVLLAVIFSTLFVTQQVCGEDNASSSSTGCLDCLEQKDVCERERSECERDKLRLADQAYAAAMGAGASTLFARAGCGLPCAISAEGFGMAAATAY